MEDGIAALPEPPYYAVIFTSLRHETRDGDGYEETAQRMFELAAEQPGCLGIETAREGVGITVGYFVDESAIRSWKEHAEHVTAQERGRAEWYDHYAVRVAKVERAYEFRRGARRAAG